MAPKLFVQTLVFCLLFSEGAVKQGIVWTSITMIEEFVENCIQGLKHLQDFDTCRENLISKAVSWLWETRSAIEFWNEEAFEKAQKNDSQTLKDFIEKNAAWNCLKCNKRFYKQMMKNPAKGIGEKVKACRTGLGMHPEFLCRTA